MDKTTLNNSTIPFLATTAEEAFWDTSKPIIFLGEWCRRYSRKSFWEPLEGEVLTSPWQNTQECHMAYYYVSDVYERLLAALGEALNSIHHVSHDPRYWRIMLGPWLKYYLPVVYDRYACLRTALDKYPGLTSIVLSPDNWVTPADSVEFYGFAQEHLYNLQVYSRIFRFLGKDFPQKQATLFATEFDLIKTDRSFSNNARSLLKRMAIAVSNKFKTGHSIIFRESHFSPFVELQLVLNTVGKVWPIYGDPPKLQRPEINVPLRDNLRNLLTHNKSFEELLNKLLPLDIPTCFIEGFNDLLQASDRTYPAEPKAIFSASAFYWDETFKQWAARSAENGTLLLFTQHGGDYGSLFYSYGEDHEIAIADRYYSWGWDKPESASKVVPGFSAKLSGRKVLAADNQKEGILLVATTLSPYLIELQPSPLWNSEYLSWQSRFCGRIHSDLLPSLRVRLRRMDFGVEMYPRWKDEHPDITVEIGGMDFLQKLESCRLYVCDHMSTTHVEALSANKPAILFWDPAKYTLRPDAKPYYDQLREAGILYDNPEAAAEAVNTAYPDIEKWWNDPNRQAARQTFCNRFARTSSNAVKEWSREFNRIAKQDIT